MNKLIIDNNDLHFTKSRGYNRRIVQLKGHAPWNVKSRRELSQNHVTKYLGTVVVVLVWIFDKTEPIHVTDERLAIRSEEQYKFKLKRCVRTSERMPTELWMSNATLKLGNERLLSVR